VHLRRLRSVTNVLFRHPPHVPSGERAAPGAARDRLGERGAPRPLPSPFLSPWRRGRGPGGRWGPPTVLCSTGPETVEPLFQRVAEMYTLPTSVPLTILRTIVKPHQKPGFLIGRVPYLCNHCVGGCQYSFALAPHLPSSSPLVRAEGG